MKIIRFQTENGPRLGLQAAGPGEFDPEGEILDLSATLHRHAADKGDKAAPVMRDAGQLAEAGLLDSGKLAKHLAFIDRHGRHECVVKHRPLRLLAPIARPKKIIALGMNYGRHAKELAWETPQEPIIFAKASSAVIGPEEPVIVNPEWGRVDPEVELAVVIARRASRVSAADALSYVGGYTVLNDFTAREMQKADMEARRPWFRSKSMDTFCPIGPAIVLADEIKDPGALALQMRVNGETRQNSTTADLIFNVPFLIEYISKTITLEPGDIIATGTPEGIAPVQPGDMMEAWVEAIGTLRNPVTADE